ncbi:MAG TPA: permease prefix domain 2-containing transporter [Vicinamibacterales bacterium]|nr:permease prefix domain 2-containing transporter [Vicinamibacterales bacterium]
MNENPPRWAERVLSLLVPDRSRDGVLGDLVEEYRESQVAARGLAGANRWYVWQVAGFLWRACAVWGVMLGGLLAARDVMDLTLPTQDYRVRAAVSTYLAFSIFGTAAIHAGWRSRHALTGVVVCLGAAVIASIIGFATPAGLSVVMWSEVQRNPAAAAALRESFDVPVPAIFAIALVLGSIGGGIGRGARSVTRISLP